MTNVKFSPYTPNGTVAAPPSKSDVHRAIICAALSGGVVVANGVVLAIETRVEGRVLEKMVQGVGLCGDHITEFSVDSPRPETLGNLLVLRGGVVVVDVEVLVAL